MSREPKIKGDKIKPSGYRDGPFVQKQSETQGLLTNREINLVPARGASIITKNPTYESQQQNKVNTSNVVLNTGETLL